MITITFAKFDDVRTTTTDNPDIAMKAMHYYCDILNYRLISLTEK